MSVRDREAKNKEHKRCATNGSLFEPQNKITLHTYNKNKQTETEIKTIGQKPNKQTKTDLLK